MFNELSIAKNCLRPENAPLEEVSEKQFIS